MNNIEIKAPKIYHENTDMIKVFLGGSIDMGLAEPWQESLIKAMDDNNIMFLNPRRDDWDSSWIQDKDNKQFSEQVNWELDAQTNADFIIYFFAKDSKSPITLLELGLFKNRNIVVYCPKGFYRKGNVDIVCAKYDIPVFDDLKVMYKILNEYFTDCNKNGIGRRLNV